MILVFVTEQKLKKRLAKQCEKKNRFIRKLIVLNIRNQHFCTYNIIENKRLLQITSKNEANCLKGDLHAYNLRYLTIVQENIKTTVFGGKSGRLTFVN